MHRCSACSYLATTTLSVAGSRHEVRSFGTSPRSLPYPALVFVGRCEETVAPQCTTTRLPPWWLSRPRVLFRLALRATKRKFFFSAPSGPGNKYTTVADHHWRQITATGGKHPWHENHKCHFQVSRACASSLGLRTPSRSEYNAMAFLSQKGAFSTMAQESRRAWKEACSS